MPLYEDVGILLNKLDIATRALLIQCGECPDCRIRLVGSGNKLWREKCPRCFGVYDVLEGKKEKGEG